MPLPFSNLKHNWALSKSPWETSQPACRQLGTWKQTHHTSKLNEILQLNQQSFRIKKKCQQFCHFLMNNIHPPCSVPVFVLAVGEHSYCREKSFKKLIESQVFLRDEISSCASNLSAQLKLGFWWWQKTRLIDGISEDCTVNQAVESKGKEYREPDVGKRLKSEKHPLADATTFVSWMQLKQIKR